MLGRNLREIKFIDGPHERGEHFNGELRVDCPHCKKPTSVVGTLPGLTLKCGCRWWRQTSGGWVRFGD